MVAEVCSGNIIRPRNETTDFTKKNLPLAHEQVEDEVISKVELESLPCSRLMPIHFCRRVFRRTRWTSWTWWWTRRWKGCSERC